MVTTFRAVAESSTRLYSAVLTDENGNRLGSSGIDSIKLTLYNRHDRAIVNSRDAQNVLNANGGSLDSQGNFTFEFTPLDTAILDDTLEYENRIALFEVVFAGTRKSAQEIEFQIRNAINVP